MMMMATVQREIPKAILIISGIVMLLAFFTDFGVFTEWKATLSSWTVLLSAVSVWLGPIYAVNAQMMNYNRNKTTANLVYLVIPILFFVLFFGTALVVPGNISSATYQWLYVNIYQNVGATVYAVMFFTLASSAYRTMRMSSIEAVALAFGGVFSTMRSIPLFTYYLPWVEGLGDWILLVPNVAGGRGAVIAAALGAIVVGIRTLAGRETTTQEVS
jgi:hypothetical protein